MRSFTITRKRSRLFVAVLGGLFAGAILFLNPAATHASPVHGNCREVDIPVALAPGLPKNKTIHGELCNPWSTPPDTVDVLVPGGSYDSLYWDFPFNNYQYSYVGQTMKAGRATFNFDRIGTGKSSKPLSALTTFDA
ncbi:MAG TPA: hypothetical protein VFT59_05565, partial [Candidatus Saccharimonadales bacterium]|nr:hypothetical protein [Candidatus Saccharimonadales bacterium]